MTVLSPMFTRERKDKWMLHMLDTLPTRRADMTSIRNLTDKQIVAIAGGRIVYLEPHQAHDLDDLIGMDDPVSDDSRRTAE